MGFFFERIVENSMTLQQMSMLRFYLSSKAKNNDGHVMSDIEYDIVAKAMALRDVTDVRSDNLPEINIRRENRAKVSNAEEDDDHN